MDETMNTNRFSLLRQLAEEALRKGALDLQHLSTSDTQELLHAVSVYHAELEIQNEELRATQQALQEARDRYRDLYDFAPVGYFTLDVSGSITEVNLTGASLLGIERARLIGCSFTQFVLPSEQDTYYFYQRQLVAKRVPQVCELRLRKADGGHFDARLESTLVSEGNLRAGSRMVIIDISARVQAEQQLRRARAELERRVQERTAELASANEALRQSEEHFRLMAEVMPGVVFTTRPDGLWDYVNQQFYAYTGLPRGAAAGSGWMVILHPDDIERTSVHWQYCITHGEPFEAEYRLRMLNGIYRWFVSRGYPLRDAAGTVIKWVGVITDIDELKRSQEALRQSEARFRVMAESMPSMVFTGQPDGACDYVNEQFYRYTGLPPGSGEGMGWIVAMHPDDQEAAAASWKIAFEHGEPCEAEYRMRRADGVYRWFVSRLQPLRASDGTIVRWVGTTTDIDDLKRAQELLRQSEEQFRQLAESMPTLVFANSPDGQCIYVNQPFCTTTGLPFEALQGDGWRVVLHPDDQERTLQQWQQSVASGRPYEIEYRFRVANGSYRWFVGRALPQYDASGTVEKWIGTCTDIDDLKRAQDALRQSEERFRVVLEQSPTSVFNHDRDLRYTWVYNPFQGFTVEDLLGKTDADIFSPSSAEQLMHIKRQAMETGTGAHTAVNITVDDTARWYDLKAEPLRNGQGAVIGLTCAATDITEYRRTMEMHRLLSEVSQQLVLSLDATTGLQAVAQLLVAELADICSIDMLADDGTIEPLVVALRDGSLPPADCPWRQSYHVDPASQHPFARIVWQEQSLCWGEVTDERLQTVAQNDTQLAQLRGAGLKSYIGVPLVARGQRMGVLGLLRTRIEQRFDEHDLTLAEEIARRTALAFDNTRLYAAEQQARQAAEQAAERTARMQRVTAALVESHSLNQVAKIVVEQGIAAMGAFAGSIVLLDAEDNHLQVVRAQGYDEALLEKWRMFPITLPSPLSTAIRECRPIWLESRQEFVAYYPNVKDGDLRGQSWAALPLVIGGQVAGGLGLSFAQARTFSPDDRAFMLSLSLQCAQALERAQLYENEQRARAQAETALQTRDQVFRLISHDLRSPLTAIQGYAHLLQRRIDGADLPDVEKMKRGLVHIASAATRMTSLIQEFLDVASIQAGKSITLSYSVLDYTALLHRIVEDHEQLSSRHTIRLETALEELIITGDELRLERVISNLLANAVKYSPQGGEVLCTLRTERREDREWAVLSIRDQGIGIPERDLPLLFKPFHRASNVSTTTPGTGLGLASVRQIVQHHGGEVTVTSEEGKGSTFTVWLPVGDEASVE